MVEMKKRGFEVLAIAPQTKKEIVEKIEKEGIRFINLPLKRGMDVFGRDFVYFLKVFFLCKKEKFFLCHNFTIKPCIFATLAQKLAGVENIFCTVTGLGYAFEKEGFLSKLVANLYKISFNFAKKVFFLNSDDRDYFLKFKILEKEKTKVIDGEGVDVEYFKKENADQNLIEKLKKELNLKEKIVISLIGRMLYQKGIKEFWEAAKVLKQKYQNLEFLLVGPLDPENPSGIKKEELEKWKEIMYIGERKEIREILALTDIVVLPSVSREGLPGVLIEAGAMEKPLIASNVPGCKEIVLDGINGFLVRPKDSQDLAKKIEILLKNESLREKFGKKAREIVKEKFDVKKIVKEIIAEYNINNGREKNSKENKKNF